MYLKQKESPWNRSWKFGIFRICFGFPIFLFLLLWTLCSVMRRPSNDAVAVWTAVSHVLLNRQRSVVIGIMIMIILSMVNGDQNYDHGHDWWGSWWYLGTSLKSTIFSPDHTETLKYQNGRIKPFQKSFGYAIFLWFLGLSEIYFLWQLLLIPFSAI